MTTLTCITTVYNDGPDLMCSVQSVLDQTHGEVEYIVLDDGSDARTKSILADLDDPRIRVLSQANDGLSSARNRALSHATGDYVCFLDADDLRPPWSFAAIMEVIEDQRRSTRRVADGGPSPFLSRVFLAVVALPPSSTACGRIAAGLRAIPGASFLQNPSG